MVGGDKKRFFAFIICPKLLDKKVFSKAPVIIEQNNNSQNAKIFQAPGFFRVPNFLGRNEKNQHL
jgi:hypothetical protein